MLEIRLQSRERPLPAESPHKSNVPTLSLLSTSRQGKFSALCRMFIFLDKIAVGGEKLNPAAAHRNAIAFYSPLTLMWLMVNGRQRGRLYPR